MKEVIQKAISNVLGTLQVPNLGFGVEHPTAEEYGDYSSNVAMVVGKQTGKNPREMAESIKKLLEENKDLEEIVQKIEVAGPGFINFHLKEEWLLDQLGDVIKKKEEYGRNQMMVGKKVMVEYTDPNPFKEFHIGHLMSNAIGESLARLREVAGATLRRVCYQGDVGMHVAKSIWGLQRKMTEDGLSLDEMKVWELKKKVNYLGQAYAYGATRYEEEETAKKEMNELNAVIYERSKDDVNQLYDAGKAWSLEYFETIYQKLGTRFDHYFFESEAGKKGTEVVKEFLEKGVFLTSDGAVVFPGEQYGLHTRVFINAQGLPTYEAKELGLASSKHEVFPYDSSVIVTGNEINEYFKVLLKAMSLVYPELAEKTKHIGHGMMKLPTGKMSSRTGKVVTGESLLADLEKAVMDKMESTGVDLGQEERNKVVSQVAVAAVKFTVLKQGIGKDIVYDQEAAISFEGDSGPYLQYTYARAQSVLRKSGWKGSEPAKMGSNLSEEEKAILRWIYRYPEQVEEAIREDAPHSVATYLLELARRYNTFYNKHQILKAENDLREMRLVITQAVAQVLANGVWILGIEAPSKM